MGVLETITVFEGKQEKVINKCDFDPSKHKIVEAEAESAEDASSEDEATKKAARKRIEAK